MHGKCLVKRELKCNLCGSRDIFSRMHGIIQFGEGILERKKSLKYLAQTISLYSMPRSG